MNFLETMRGEKFLLFYFFWFILTWFGMLTVRYKVSDTIWTSLGGLLAFESVGAARYLIGSAQGMHKWEFLIMMMGFGALFFLARSENSASGSNGSWGGSSCGGGGCGGGGCGGGGCGGCGGS